MSSSRNVQVTDIIYGQIELEPYCREIIAREEFQRLHNVLQLGSSRMVYPSTVGTRYAHSIGVCYLASKLMDTLENNSNKQIPIFYRKCVSIAGLLHDLGHGPYSHMWESLMEIYFNETYHHEDVSCSLVKRIFRNITNVFENAEEQKRGVRLIQSLIRGNLDDLGNQLGADMYVAEIISNKFSEIDVDRVDYILRDIFYMNYSVESVDHKFDKFLKNAKIIEGPDGVKHINYLEDDLEPIYYLFKNRVELHKHVYQNSDVIASQILLCDFFKAADDNNFKFNDAFRLNEVANENNLTAFVGFDDQILAQILSQLTITTPQYETFKRYIINKQKYRRLNEDEYNKLQASGEYCDDNFREFKRSIEDPFKKFKIFFDRHLLYNRNNNQVMYDVAEVKRKLKLDVNRALERDTDEETFYYFVEN